MITNQLFLGILSELIEDPT